MTESRDACTARHGHVNKSECDSHNKQHMLDRCRAQFRARNDHMPTRRLQVKACHSPSAHGLVRWLLRSTLIIMACTAPAGLHKCPYQMQQLAWPRSRRRADGGQALLRLRRYLQRSLQSPRCRGTISRRTRLRLRTTTSAAVDSVRALAVCGLDVPIAHPIVFRLRLSDHGRHLAEHPTNYSWTCEGQAHEATR